MAHFNKEKALEIIKSGDMDDIQALLDDLEERLNTKKYGLIWERGGNDEDSAFEAENVVLDCQHNMPYPKLRSDLSTNPEKANGNMLLEGDNYIWLKLLEQTHAGEIDIIYIDPPYNTGNNDFKYNDRFVDPEDVFRHSKWLDFMNKRLVVARKLLTQNGIIFISCDEHEQAALKLLCDEIFNVDNYIGTFFWRKTETPANLSKKIKTCIEYVLCYEKKKNNTRYGGIVKQSGSNGLMNQSNTVHELIFPPDIIKTGLSDGTYPAGKYGTKKYDIRLLEDCSVKDGVFTSPVRLEGRFKWGQDYLDAALEAGTEVMIMTKAFSPSYIKAEPTPDVPTDLILRDTGVGTNENASSALFDMLGPNDFSYPKPPSLIKYLVNFTRNKEAIILDFFAGTGTTAQAIEELNQEDGGHRQWILITNNEDQDNDDGDPETGICRDITKPRIDTVITGIRPDGSKYSDGTDSGYQYFQYDFMPRYESREANQRAFFTPTKNIDAIVRIKYGVVLKDLDRDRMAMTYENDTRQVIVFIKDIDIDLMNEFFDDEHDHIVISNDTIDVDGVESNTIHSLIPSYEFFM